jgi:hypothetical protein
VQALQAAEQQALQERRSRALGGDASAARPRAGLALSGGGVRSATFALGLMRGLARPGPRADRSAPPDPTERTGDTSTPANREAVPGVLGRVDYLSTVSGGGYSGAMWGRLVATYGLERALALMTRSDSPVLQWLRRNGRYLTPTGSRDLGIAVVTYLRPVIAIHIEFMFACMLLGLLVVAPHLWQHTLQPLQAQGWERWFTPWWALSLAWWAATAPGLLTGYWAARDAPDPGARSARVAWRDGLFVGGAALGVGLLLRELVDSGALNPQRDGLNWPIATALGLVSGVLGQALVQLRLATTHATRALAVATLRNALTRALRTCTLVALGLAALGALDRLSWWVLEELQSGNDWLWGGVGLGGLIVLVLRTLMQPLQQLATEATADAGRWLPRLINIAGYLGLLALVTAWLVVLQWFVFAPETFEVFRNVPAWMRAGLVAAVWALWVLLTAGNAQMANSSSLHSFYRARLTRAYLAVGNPQRGLGGLQGQTPAAPGADDVTCVVEGDDTALAHYRPESQGGPIHLVNTCLNQTRDDRSGLYNADRKGAALTASWRGLEIGPSQFVPLQAGPDVGTLGRWVALSGAAASPGAGSYTSRGLALLIYFLGVRLGQWVHAPQNGVRLRWLSAFAWRSLIKPVMLTSEASATFFGVERPWWYLSDGGHFENTGVYPLIKRELDFIILSDASCDAQYEFGDIENLVRKARIDFGAEIEFYSREEAARLLDGDGDADGDGAADASDSCCDLTVVSPEDLADNHSCRGVLLARIRYRERLGAEGEPYRPEGTLLVVKPNLHDGLDVDLLAYAQKNPAFPHESTGDQSFDEAQWESYHRLGEDFGRAITDAWLARLPGWRTPAAHGLHVAARLRSADAAIAAANETPEPRWRRSARAAAVGTTLGVGASGTLLLGLWQVQEQLRRNEIDQQTEARALFTEVSKGLADFNGACPKVPEHLVTQVSLLLDLRQSPVMRPLERAGIERLAGRIGDECSKPADASADCLAAVQRMQGDLCALVLKPPTENTALNYWHPGASPDEQAAAARRVWAALVGRDALTESPPIVVAQADAPTPAGAEPAATEAAAASRWPTPPSASAPAASNAGGGLFTGGGGGGGVTGHGAGTDGLGAAAAAADALPACAAQGRSTLYIQVYDEASRALARALRRRLEEAGNGSLQVAPVENVTRSAELRGQRRPVPWPQPTFVLHDASRSGCARALAGLIGEPWVQGAAGQQVWVRTLPPALKARNMTPERAGVFELWLPPLPAGPADQR